LVHSDSCDGVRKDIRIIGITVTEWVERKGHTLEKAMITGVFDQGIKKLILFSTPDACKKYNSLFRNGRKVALLAHGTC
jgi:hypothetical protein